VVHIPDLATRCPFASGDAIRAVGWLEPGYEYRTGRVRAPARFLRNIQDLLAESHLPSAFPVRVDYMGVHTCGFCRAHYGNGELLVPHGDFVFIAPTMIVHYVQFHGYLPPDEFVKAVNFCPLPSSLEYRQMMAVAVRPGPGGHPRVSR